MSAPQDSRAKRGRARANRLATPRAPGLPCQGFLPGLPGLAILLGLIALLGLAALTARPALAAQATTHPKPSEDQLRHDGYRFAGEKFEDKFPEIPGDETNIRIFQKGQETLGLYILPSGQVYGYAVKVGSQPITAYIDEYNTGYCEKDYGDGESFRIDFASYRQEPGYDSGRRRQARRK
jgi:hypothetical protein